VLCLQQDIADHVLPMLEGAMAELAVGNPDRLSTDVGPVISAEATQRLTEHVERMRARGNAVTQSVLPAATRTGLFVPPTIIEIGSMAELPGEVFGPVLHVLRYPRERLDEVVRQANVVLVTGDEDYVVVDAQPNQYLPHVALMLRRSRPEGA